MNGQQPCAPPREYVTEPGQLDVLVPAMFMPLPREDGEGLRNPWQAMVYAPRDGSEIELLLHHSNRRFAEGDARLQWEAIVRARWTDFNHGGWVWSGMYGETMGWRYPR